MIILTDGLPNLAVGYNDLVTYDGLTDVIAQTTATLNSLDNIDVITVLTGIDNEEATFRTDGTNIYTYGQVITEVFGTEDAPNKGEFYKIDDTEIEKTITDEIYNDLVSAENEGILEDVTILDYFPKYITDNFDVTLHNESDTEIATIMTDSDGNQYISWQIDKLSPGESRVLNYTISLKDEFDESIIGKILDTNEKVDITYKELGGTDESVSSDVTPKIKLTAVPQPEPPKDDTVVQEPIPDAGSPVFSFAFILIIGLSLFFGYKSRKIR